MDKNMALTRLYAIALGIFIITFSIALPVFIRPFYYMHIEPLSLPDSTDMSYEQIKSAYDEVLNYIIIPGREFGTGDFPHSVQGYEHFKDCKVIFGISNSLLLLSALTLITLSILKRKTVFELEKRKGMHISYTVAKRILIFSAILVLLISLSFEKAFNLFHKIIFPGRENWILDYKTDPLILAMPEVFFRNCAILIFASVIIQTVAIITVNIIKSKKKPR